MKSIEERTIVLYLLELYENSVQSKQGSSRRLAVGFHMRDYDPSYFDSGEHARQQGYDTVFERLEKRGLVLLVRDGYFVVKVRLNLEKIDSAYDFVDQVSIVTRRQQLIRACHEFQNRMPILHPYCAFLLEKLESFKSIKTFVKDGQVDDLTMLLEGVAALYAQIEKEEISKRKFSQNVYADSKTFENLENRILALIRAVDGEIPFSEKEDILQYFNIVNNPGYIYFKGCGSFAIGQTRFDLEDMAGSIGFSSEMIHQISPLALNVERIMTIENLTSFHQYKTKNELVIYLAGFHNTLRRNFLSKLYALNPQCNYAHFGDIDVGGFEIFFHLRGKTGIPFNTFKMDVETLLAYRQFGKPLTDNDKTRLKKLSEKHPLPVFDTMAELNLKLEQEVVS